MTEAEEKFEVLIEGLLANNYGVCDDFLQPELVRALRRNLLGMHTAGEMHAAGIGQKADFQRDETVRGDVIKWLDDAPEDDAEQELLDHIQAFTDYLNRTCFTGINGSEFHYAYYAQHSFYKRHIDQFKADQGRQYSLVIYLNENWQEADAGQISLYTADGEKRLLPLGGRAVFFKSDVLPHEVHASATRYRLSVTGWLKRI